MRRRPVPLDTALAAVPVLGAGAAMAADLEPEARAPDVLAYVLVLGLGAPMLVRRRWPVGTLLATVVVLLAYHALGYSAVGFAVPLAPALYSAAEAGRLRPAVVTGGVMLASTTTWRIYDADRDRGVAAIVGYDTVSTLALMAAAVALGDAVHARRGWQAELRQRLRLARMERDREARERVKDERVRIAREIHDVLAHTVAVITIQAGVAAEALDDDPAASCSALTTIRTVSREALADLRGTVGLLRGATESEPLPPTAVAGLADVGRVLDSAAADGLQVRLDVAGEAAPLPSVVGTTAHRIVQESLTNVLRHAHARHAHVRLRYAARALTVTVADDGRGRTDTADEGYGLRGMRERVTLLGGDFRAGNRPDGGFEVTAVLPTGAQPTPAPSPRPRIA
ncbi:MAG TPA: sensor histidine kinase [Frankiaceae bacterium]|nr:sensor histidine kinase [Frankiaceae bacterium]